MPSVTLAQLLDLSIGTPEVGSVNFSNLYRLLSALLQRLDLKDIEISVDGNESLTVNTNIYKLKNDNGEEASGSSPYHVLEGKIKWLTDQIEQLSELPSTMQIHEQIRATGDNQRILSDMWQYMQLKGRVDTNEDGINKLLSMIADLMKKMEELQESDGKLTEKLEEFSFENVLDKILDMEESIKTLFDRLHEVLNPESPFVTWEVLENALKGKRRVSSAPANPYRTMFFKMRPRERSSFVEDIIKSDTLHQYLPNVDGEFENKTPEERSKIIEDSIEHGTFQNLLTQSPTELLKMNEKERRGFIEDAQKINVLNDFLPGLEDESEGKTIEEKSKKIEDSIQAGTFHKFYPCKFKSVQDMPFRLAKSSIEALFRTKSLESHLPGITEMFKEKKPDEQEKFIKKAAKVGLVEAYKEEVKKDKGASIPKSVKQESSSDKGKIDGVKSSKEKITPDKPVVLSDAVKKNIDKAIIRQSQELMYENNGQIETELAREAMSKQTVDKPKSAKQQYSRTPSVEDKQSVLPTSTPVAASVEPSEAESSSSPRINSRKESHSSEKDKTPLAQTPKPDSRMSESSPEDNEGSKKADKSPQVQKPKPDSRMSESSPEDNEGSKKADKSPHVQKPKVDSGVSETGSDENADSNTESGARPKSSDAMSRPGTGKSRPGTGKSRPGTSMSSRGSTPARLIACMSPGPSSDILEVLDRLGMLYQQHNQLVDWVKAINDKLKRKGTKEDLKQLSNQVAEMESLLGNKLDRNDIDQLLGQLSDLQSHIGSIQILVDELTGREPVQVKGSMPNIDSLLESRLADSKAFEELIERVCGLESKLIGFQESFGAKSRGLSQDELDALAIIKDGVSEISSDQDLEELKQRRKKSVKESLPEVKGSPSEKLDSPYQHLYETARKGSITHDIICMLQEVEESTDDTGSEKLKRIGLILDEQLNVVRDTISSLESDLKLMAKSIEAAIEKVKRVGGSERTQQSVGSSRKSSTNLEREALQRAQDAIAELKGEIDHLQATTRGIIQANRLKQEQIQDIMMKNEDLYQTKADKDFVLDEFRDKADKRMLENKVNQTLFNKATEEINKTIKEVEEKLEGSQTTMNSFFSQLSEDVDGKIDRLEMDPLKVWIDGRLNELNKKITKIQPGWSEDDAAGLRKQLIQRFHCLSCDKTINMTPKPPIKSLPSQTSVQATRSPRPFTIYELNQIRQHASRGIINRNILNFERALLERQLARIRKADLKAFLYHYSNELQSLGLKKNVSVIDSQDSKDFFARTRACGGLHTMTFPHRRPVRVAGFNIAENEAKDVGHFEEHYQECGEEADVQGADGIIYKGRCTHLEKNLRGQKVMRKVTPHATSTHVSNVKPAPTPSGRPVSALNTSKSSQGSGRSPSRPVSARPNTGKGTRNPDGLRDQELN